MEKKTIQKTCYMKLCNLFQRENLTLILIKLFKYMKLKKKRLKDMKLSTFVNN